jgi:hypothetical protein
MDEETLNSKHKEIATPTHNLVHMQAIYNLGEKRGTYFSVDFSGDLGRPNSLEQNSNVPRPFLKNFEVPL